MLSCRPRVLKVVDEKKLNDGSTFKFVWGEVLLKSWAVTNLNCGYYLIQVIIHVLKQIETMSSNGVV